MFASIDGLDGSGKSTASKILAEKLRREGTDVMLLEHPGNGFLGRTCRRFLVRKGIPASLSAAAFLSLEMFLNSFRIRRSGNAISVRYTLSAYYLPEPIADPVFRIYSAVMPRPDAMLFIDVDPAVAAERTESRGGEREMFENAVSMREVRGRILSVPGVTAVDGSGTPEETAELLLQALRAVFPSNIF